MDPTMAEVKAATGLDESTIVAHRGHVFVARRNNEGGLRFQIFRDTEITPCGVLQAHRCHFHGGPWRLCAYGTNGEVVDCVGNYLDALDQLAIGPSLPRSVDG